jgi:protocatechuate 3,4-dioxygenase beta subunit
MKPNLTRAHDTPPSRRRRLLAGTAAAGALALLLPRRTRAQAALPAATEGPFYPPRAWRERMLEGDADLTRVGPLRAEGEALGLVLAVVDARGTPIDGCEVEIWQCDAQRAYRHPSVPMAAGRHDPGFQGHGAARADARGEATFRTIRPVPYPGRTPHIHLKLRHASFGEFTSQLYVQGDEGNAGDFLFRRLGPAGQAAASMRLAAASGEGEAGLRWRANHRLVLPG